MAIKMTHEDIEGIQKLISRMRRENQALRMAAKDALDILEAEINNRTKWCQALNFINLF